MRTKPFSHSAGLKRSLLATAASMALAAPALAVEFGNPTTGISGSWDTTISYGSVWRTQGQNSGVICTSNGGRSRSCNYDDGILNYDTGQVSNVFKVLSEIQADYKNFGAFVRASYFYDTEADETKRTSLTSDAKDQVEQNFDLLDAFVYGRFDIGDMPAEIRVGKQVVSWGEGTFFPSGMGSLNYFDVTKLRGAAVNLKEGLQPQEQVYFSISPTENTTFEAFYQWDWDDTEPDPVGSWFSTNDFAVDGIPRQDPLMLGFGAWSDQGTDWRPLGGFFDPSFQHIPYISRGENTPDDDGQYGVAFRYFMPNLLGGTEIGLYYANYHSRLPVLSGVTGTQEGYGNALGALAAAQATALGLASGLSFDAAVAQGTVAGVGAAGSNGGDITAQELNSWATVGGNTYLGGGDVTSLALNLAVDQLGKTSGYFREFPEDIEIYGLSFSTDVFGLAWQGEYTYKVDTPLQLDDVELLFKALSPLDPLAAQIGLAFPDCTTVGGTNPNAIGQFGCWGQQGPAYSASNPLGINEELQGWREKDVSQFQTTVTYLSDPIIGADVGALVIEAAATYVHGFESKRSGGPNGQGLRYDGSGTFVSGNELLAGRHFDEFESGKWFPDKFSWGYRMLATLTYNNAIGAWSVSPRLGFRQDLNGVTPGPGGNFIEGRTTTTIGLRGLYQNKWQLDVSWTSYNGAGHHNLVTDRDFLAFSAQLSF